ncbi:hypothetical protein DL96DRAFT_624955 [Flagelloscypha sp. PMI_526]|nr:hypothetical protein DL96DRAFT_624955 [Flagelloscypha sp. PMI_526]
MPLPMGKDVLTEIVHFVHDIDRQTIISLNVVDSNFHSLTLPFVYRECSFDLSDGVKPEYLQRIQSWLDQTGNLFWVPNAIRHLTLRNGRNSYFALDSNSWAPFLELIPRMNRLMTFVFDMHNTLLPVVLLQALEVNIPQVSLIIRSWNRGYRWGAELDDRVEALSRSPLLREIHTVDTAAPRDITFIALRRLISLAPKLQKVVVGAPHPTEKYRGFCGNAWLGHRETIAFAEERFNLSKDSDHQQVLQELRHLELTYAPTDFAEQCLRIVNPEHLERLELDLSITTNPAVINPLTFTALRHLALDIYGDQSHSVLASFLQVQCMGASLESFSLRTFCPIPDTILPQLLATHGPTLKTLALRNDLPERQYWRSVVPFSPIRQESICLIRDTCPVLERLTLCISRQSEAAVFDIFAEFSSSLRHLTLDFGSGCSFIHVPASTSEYFNLQEGADFELQLKQPSEDVEEWEQMLWLHVPLVSSDVEEMFGKIYKKGNGASSLETLVVRIRHPWASNTQQEFLVQRHFGGMKLTTTSVGYNIPEDEKLPLEFNNKVQREERLRLMWETLCPWKLFPLEKSFSEQLGTMMVKW